MEKEYDKELVEKLIELASELILHNIYSSEYKDLATQVDDILFKLKNPIK